MRKTAEPAEACEPDKYSGVKAKSSAQEEAVNIQQHEAENGQLQEDTVMLGENDEQQQETELAKIGKIVDLVKS